MTEGTDRFYGALPNAANISDRGLVEWFVYFITVELGKEAARVKSVNGCFATCDLAVPSRTAAYLSEGVANGRLIKVSGGYKLHRHIRSQLSDLLDMDSSANQTSKDLRMLEAKVPPGAEKGFLSETIRCFEVGANRAAIVMCWILAMEHLYEFVFANKLTEFNAELVKVTDRRVKVSQVHIREDFDDIPEGKFIELLRGAGIISNDVRKILDGKLGTRNSCAHPSGIKIKTSKVVEFIDDLVENIVLKFEGTPA
jgi:hypothetical protein